MYIVDMDMVLTTFHSFFRAWDTGQGLQKILKKPTQLPLLIMHTEKFQKR